MLHATDKVYRGENVSDEALIVLFLCAVALGWAARQVRVPYLIMLVLGGVLLGFIPGLPQVPLNSGLILFIVLPPILYQAALFTSWRDFRRHLRVISSLAIGLVLATTLAVAVTVHLLIPTLPWAAAFALGAIISPPDVVATTAVLSRFKAIQFKSCNAMRVAPRWDYNSQHTTLE
jgi:CPA1 family monovalent cation:H+ antiporter